MPRITKANVDFIADQTPIRKDSGQLKDSNQVLWIEPRLDFTTLATFYDWNSWHRRCILIKAGATCGLGWDLVTEDPDKEHDDEYKRVKDFLAHCNTEMSFTRLAFRAAIDYFHMGNLFVEVVYNRKGELAELYHAPVTTMRVGTEAKTYWQIRYGLQKKFQRYGSKEKSANEIAHLAAYDPLNDYYGMPEWLPAMATMALDRNAVTYNTYNFENEFLAKVLLFIKGAKLDKEVRSRLKAFFSGQYKGIENAGKAVVIDVDDPNIDIKVERLQADLKDMSFLESRKFNRDEVIEAHNVPPRLLGILQAGQLGGAGEVSGQLKVFRDITIKPVKAELEEFFNSILVPKLGMTKWRLEFKLFDITTELEDGQYLSQVFQFLSDDEARNILGYEPRETPAVQTQPETPAPVQSAGELVKNLVQLRKALEQNDADAAGL